MLKRIALVAWWMGALALVAATVIATGFFISNPERNWQAFSAIPMAAIITAPLWALSFILAGSFWKPPKIEDEEDYLLRRYSGIIDLPSDKRD